MPRKPSDDVLTEALSHVKKTFEYYKKLNENRKSELIDVYEEYSTFKMRPEQGWSTSFKVNQAHALIEKVLARVLAKNPRWIVSGKSQKIDPKHVNTVQDYLWFIFEEYNLYEPFSMFVKDMLIYGKGYAKIKYKWEIAREGEEVDSPLIDEETGEGLMDEFGEPVTIKQKQVKEKVWGEYPTIEVKSFTDIYYDSRIVFANDRPAWIDVMNGIRLADLHRSDEYFNLDKLKSITNLNVNALGLEEYRKEVQRIAGVQVPDDLNKIDENSLTIKTYYGYFNKGEKPTDERLYEIVVANDVLVIKFEEISYMPYEEAKCFDDPETAHAIGYVEPIMSIQQEMNFKKNSASEYINKSLTRQVVWSPQSGIDPKTINDPVIVTDKDGASAMNNFVELGHRTLDSSYFAEQNDIQREIQVLTNTVDVTTSRSQQSLTNTATGARISFFESNAVLDMIRRKVERALERLAYKLLLETFEKMESNIVIKKQGTDEYWEINKELLRDAVSKYQIRVEANSSSFDDVESRRDEALALMTLAERAKLAGVDVNMKEVFIDAAETFERKDVNKLLNPPNIQTLMGGLMGQQGAQGQPKGTAMGTGMSKDVSSDAAKLTEQVAQGGLTQGK